MSGKRLRIANNFEAALKVRNFRLLLIGETVSMVGDQCYAIALPWLVLRLTASGVALGSVLMTRAIPLAVLMLAGGAITDRFSPRTVMLVSNIMRGLNVASLTVLVFSGVAHLWHIFIVAATFSTFDAFFYPAAKAIIPTLLDSEDIAAGNSLMQVSARFAGLVGPAAAGLLIARTGLATAFFVDAASFMVSIGMLALLPSTSPGSASRPLVASIREGISHVWNQPITRSLLVSYAAMSLFFTGPFVVGAPLLAAQRFRGATALGVLYSTFGIGSLSGTLIAGNHRGPSRTGPMLVMANASAGLSMIALSTLWHLWIAAALLAILGLILGYTNVQMLGYLQRQTEAAKMGRVMSLVMFCTNGLLPFAYMLAGMVSRLGTKFLFLGSGISVVVLTAVLFREPQFWRKTYPFKEP